LLIIGSSGWVLQWPLIPWVARIGLLIAWVPLCLTLFGHGRPWPRITGPVWVTACGLLLASIEIRWMLWRAPTHVRHSHVIVLGDSISGGIGSVNEPVWPLQFQRQTSTR